MADVLVQIGFVMLVGYGGIWVLFKLVQFIHILFGGGKPMTKEELRQHEQWQLRQQRLREQQHMMEEAQLHALRTHEMTKFGKY